MCKKFFIRRIAVMGLFSAIGKGIARLANDKYAENRRKKAKKVAFENAGERMKNASKHHTYINGSKTFKEELRKENRKIKEQHKRTDHFISDL